MSLLTDYLNIYKLYIIMNTGLLASAAVKRFEGLVSTHLRSRLRPSGLYILMR